MAAMSGFLAAAILGAMLFFGAVIAPLVFKVLNVDDGGRFLRQIFPTYYIVLGGAAGVGAVVAMAFGQTVVAAIFAAVAVLMLASRYVAIPIINEARDAMLAGDDLAKVKFDRWHMGTVILNFIEMIMLVAILYLTAQSIF